LNANNLRQGSRTILTPAALFGFINRYFILKWTVSTGYRLYVVVEKNASNKILISQDLFFIQEIVLSGDF
jgi:hypothetical protein